MTTAPCPRRVTPMPPRTSSATQKWPRRRPTSPRTTPRIRTNRRRSGRAAGLLLRKLADRVAGSTKEIRALVEEIHAAVNTTILATEMGSKAVDAGLHRFEEVTRGFKEIAGMVGTTTQAAREIGLSTKQQM